MNSYLEEMPVAGKKKTRVKKLYGAARKVSPQNAKNLTPKSKKPPI